MEERAEYASARENRRWHSGGWGETFLAGANFHARSCSSQPLKVYSYFEKGCGKKMCTPQSRKAIWDMVNTLFLTLQLSKLLLLLSFSTHKHMSMVSRAILSSFFEEQWTQNHPQSRLSIVACIFSDNLFRNSCRQIRRQKAKLSPGAGVTE